MLAIIHTKIFCLSVSYRKLKIIYINVILPVVLYAYETWSLALREEHRLTVFENRVSRNIFGPKSVEYGPLRNLHNDELHGLYSSPNIVRVFNSRRIRWEGHVARMGRDEVCTVFGLGSPKGRNTGKTEA
jgi:hypothetical protein